MRMRLLHLYRDERGMSFVFVGLGFMAFMASTTLAIDVGMLMTARSQAQNSADAGALAGAIALAFNDFDDRSATGPAVQSAISAAQANPVMAAAVSIMPSDVTFPNDPSGNPTQVAVNVFRASTRDNPIPTLIGPIFGVPSVNIGATATAEASPATAMTCVKPFMIPDKWQESQTGPWDPSDTFEMFRSNGEPLPNPDIYVPLGNEGYTGYTVENDTGLQLVLRAGTGNNIEPTMYYSWSMPGGGGDIGADFYSGNISGCSQTIIPIPRPETPYYMVQEPGNMVGPTEQGIDDLIAKDPNATWDLSCNCVRGSVYGISPRVTPIPLYDPVYYTEGKRNGRNADFKLANIIGFFIERRAGNQVYGRITPISGLIDGSGPAPEGSFPVAIRLVQ